MSRGDETTGNGGELKLWVSMGKGADGEEETGKL